MTFLRNKVKKKIILTGGIKSPMRRAACEKKNKKHMHKFIYIFATYIQITDTYKKKNPRPPAEILVPAVGLEPTTL